MGEELYPSDDEEEDELTDNYRNDGVEDVNRDHTMKDESSSESEHSDKNIKEENAQPMIIQQEHKIQVKFENKSLGMKVAKGNNKLWVDTIIKKSLKKKIKVNDTIRSINGKL